MIKALIFDMDNTLIFTSLLHRESFEIALKKFGADINLVPEKIDKNLQGKRIDDISAEYIKFFGLAISVKELLDEKEKVIGELLKKAKPMPGFSELKKFLDKGKFRVALATSSRMMHVRILDKIMGIKFDAIVTGEEVKNGKPAPDIYKLALEKLKLSRNEAIVVEDSENGINSALKAGIKVIGVRNTIIDEHQNVKIADIFTDNLKNIEGIVNSLTQE